MKTNDALTIIKARIDADPVLKKEYVEEKGKEKKESWVAKNIRLAKERRERGELLWK